MATLASILNNLISAGTMAEAETAAIGRELSDEYKLRKLPNEDVYFFVKRIDNSRVVKQADPRARATSWKVLLCGCVATLTLIGFLLPNAYGLMAGYQISQLEQEHQRLAVEQSRLDLEEARLVSSERLQELAAMQQFMDPAPERTVYLSPKDSSSVALNRN
jgi:hypothetical protein